MSYKMHPHPSNALMRKFTSHGKKLCKKVPLILINEMSPKKVGERKGRKSALNKVIKL